MIDLRDYQTEAHDALYAGWADGKRRLGVSLPTGTGKTRIMAKLAETELARGDGRRTLYLVHRDELVHQTVATLRATLPAGTSVGVVKAERDEVGARVIVASVHSLRSERRRAKLPPCGLAVVDEAHVSVSPTYLSVYDAIGAFRPDGARLAGFTATWSRSDGAGLGDVWEDIAFARDIRWAIRRDPAILVRPRGIQVGEGIDMDDVRVSRSTGDYREEDLARAVMLEDLRDTVVRGALTYQGERPGVLFAPTVASAEYFGEALTAAGMRTEGIFHTTSPTQRRALFADHLAGRVRILSTCTALAEGWDSPHTSVAHLLRPTRHRGLLVQIAGRTLRLWPGKLDALLLDYVGLFDDLDLRSAIDLSETRPVRLVDDEADAELLDEDEADEWEAVRDGVTVRTRKRSREVDLFAGTAVTWLRTREGIPFVGCGDSYVFVVPTADGWNVGQCKSYSTVGGRFLAEGLDAQVALEVAAERAEDTGKVIARRDARWRGGAPTDGQRRVALELGLPLDGMRRGDVSDAIDVARASSVLAPMAAWSRQLLST